MMRPTMFPYDAQLQAALQPLPQTIPGVLETMQAIDTICADGDGLKWFNWLYLRVTQTVEDRVTSSSFADPAWMAALDVQFAGLYFQAAQSLLSGGSQPGCWAALFAVRNQPRLARIQFAFAGMNAHINHDLPMAVVKTCKAFGATPQHRTPQYNDYTSINATLSSLIDVAKSTLRLRLLGDDLPAISALDDTLAAWSITAAREAAWNNAELLNHVEAVPQLADGFMDTLDGLTSVVGKTLLVPLS